MDERTLREIYAPPFEAAVAAGVGSVMWCVMLLVLLLLLLPEAVVLLEMVRCCWCWSCWS